MSTGSVYSTATCCWCAGCGICTDGCGYGGRYSASAPASTSALGSAEGLRLTSGRTPRVLPRQQQQHPPNSTTTAQSCQQCVRRGMRGDDAQARMAISTYAYAESPLSHPGSSLLVQEFAKAAEASARSTKTLNILCGRRGSNDGECDPRERRFMRAEERCGPSGFLCAPETYLGMRDHIVVAAQRCPRTSFPDERRRHCLN